MTQQALNEALAELSSRRLLPLPLHRSPRDLGLEVNPGTDYRSKYRGTLIGGAVGDALGRPAEGLRSDEVRGRYGSLQNFTPSWTGAAGSTTDDTQLTICTAESIMVAGKVDPVEMADRFVRWLPEGRGVGMTCAGAVRNLMRGNPWYQSGLPSAGNGAAMRIAPIGLLHPLSPNELRRDSAISTVITHADPMAVVSAVAQAFSVAYCLHRRPGTFNVEQYLGCLRTILGDLHDPGYCERRPGSTRLVRLADRIAELGSLIESPPQEVFDHLGNGAFVLESLPAALWCFLRSPEDPEQVVVTAVSGGNDADTVASMAGTLSGAYLGEAAIPGRWRGNVEFAEKLGTLADGLLHLSGLARSHDQD